MAVPFQLRTILSRTAEPAVIVLLLALCFTAVATGQRRRTGSQLRALAVVEFPETGAPRLVPVTILVEDRFYDAGIYKASPVPVSLEPGTVYEAQRAGEPTGLFVVTRPAQLRHNWIAGGDWKPQDDDAPQTKKQAPQPTGAPVDPDAPPVLRRGSSQEQAQETKPTSPASSPAPAQGDESGPPVLRRPQAASGSAPAPAPSAPPQASAQSQSPEDPNRPRLRRNPEGSTPSQVENAKDALPSPENAPWKIKQVYVAVSDAKAEQLRNYAFDWRPDEKERLQRQAEVLASSALKSYAETRAHVPAGALQDVTVQAFNLDFSNIPYVVLTATARPAATRAPSSASPGPDFRFHVTVIARPSPTQELRQVLAVVTDTTRLDVFPELQLVDAVDADGDGRAELLFAEITDLGRAYKLYRLVGDNATELFTSAPIQNSSYRP